MKDEQIERKWNIFLIGLSKERSWKARYGILDGRDQFQTVQGTHRWVAPELPSYRRDTRIVGERKTIATRLTLTAVRVSGFSAKYFEVLSILQK